MNHGIIIARLFASVIISLSACTGRQEAPAQLAQKHCGSCHLFPPPALLDKGTWEKRVLPQMAFRMGLDFSMLQQISQEDMPDVLKTLPDKALVTEAEWRAIRNYYVHEAPDTLPRGATTALPHLKQFIVSEASIPRGAYPAVTLIRYDTISGKFFVGTRHGWLYQMNTSLTPEDSFRLPSPASDILFYHQHQVLACMGIMDPNDQALGSIVGLHAGHNATLYIDSIKRPVYIQAADLNNDTETDIVVAAFGNYTGALLAFEKHGSHYMRHVIHSLPGTRRAIVKDFNGDGLNDVLALITQGDEQITLFENKGNFEFAARVLLRFPPVYGSSYFDVKDLNNDGLWDILYTNGDNADYSAVLKPYHGIRIYTNDGRAGFTENWFYPMHGASQAVARDFDGDGDMDIAAIAFFPDFHNTPERGFLYFNNDNGKFKASIIPGASLGRWLTMEVADLDDDGDDDLLLGALNFTAGVPEGLRKKWKATNTSVLVLKNTLH